MTRRLSLVLFVAAASMTSGCAGFKQFMGPPIGPISCEVDGLPLKSAGVWIEKAEDGTKTVVKRRVCINCGRSYYGEAVLK